MEFHHSHDNPCTPRPLDLHNEETNMNRDTLNQDLEIQSSRHDSIQHLEMKMKMMKSIAKN